MKKRIKKIIKVLMKYFDFIKENLLLIIFTILFLGTLALAVYTLRELMIDHYCYNLPITDFYKEKKCEKYWRMR